MLLRFHTKENESQAVARRFHVPVVFFVFIMIMTFPVNVCRAQTMRELFDRIIDTERSLRQELDWLRADIQTDREERQQFSALLKATVKSLQGKTLLLGGTTAGEEVEPAGDVDQPSIVGDIDLDQLKSEMVRLKRGLKEEKVARIAYEGTLLSGLDGVRTAVERINAGIEQSKQETKQGIDQVNSELGQIKQETKEGVNHVSEKLGEIKQETKQGIDQVNWELGQIKNATKQELEGIKEGTKQGIDHVTKKLGEIKQETKQGIDQVNWELGQIKNATKQELEGIKEGTKQGIDQVKEELREIKKETKQGIDQVIEELGQIKNETKQELEVIKEGTKQGIDQVKEELREIKKETKQGIDQVIEELGQIKNETKQELEVIKEGTKQGIDHVSVKLEQIRQETMQELGVIKEETAQNMSQVKQELGRVLQEVAGMRREASERQGTLTNALDTLKQDHGYLLNKHSYIRLTELVNGVSTVLWWTGRIEVLRDGEWGTVCDDGFGEEEAAVLCKSFGYKTGTVGKRDGAEWGTPPSDRIWLDNIQCMGQESSLFLCGHRGWGRHNCGHSEDVGVICTYSP